MLTEEQKQELDVRLEQTWTGSRACPVCGRENWNRLDMIFEERLAEKFQDEEDAPTLPLIHLSCFTCGYVISFNAITLKLVHPLLKSSEEEGVTAVDHISDILNLSGVAQERNETAFPDPSKPARRHSSHDAHILGMHLDSLMNQSVNFMILGALVSLIALANQGNAFLHIYLSRIVWYFLAAIFLYYLTSSRGYMKDLSNLLGTNRPHTEQESDETAGDARPAAPNAGRTFRLLAANKILVMLFIISFIAHFYLFTFGTVPFSLREELLFNVALLALGAAAFAFVERKSSRVV